MIKIVTVPLKMWYTDTAYIFVLKFMRLREVFRENMFYHFADRIQAARKGQRTGGFR